MAAPLIPDQRPFLDAYFKLRDLQDAMQFPVDKFERFLYLTRETAQEQGLDTKKQQSQQDPKKWKTFVSEMVKQEKKLETFVDHWPIETYFNLWSYRRASSDMLKGKKSTKVKALYRKSLTSQPLNTITNRSQKSTRSVQRQLSSQNINGPSSAESARQGNPALPALAKFDGPYDKTIRQPCLKCGGVPPMVSRCLREAFKHDLAAKGELTKMGIHCDLDIDTFMLMDSAQRDELFRSSGVTNVMRVSIVHMLKKLKGRSHVKADISEDDLRLYLARVYTCPEHLALDPNTAIPRQLRELFNKCHIEHLIPAAILLGVTSDAEYNKVVLEFDEEEREQVLFHESEFVSLSPIQKNAMKWAFGLPV